jgi:hypothetical protein
VKSPTPRLAGGVALGRGEEVLERHVDEGRPGLGEHLEPVAQLCIHVDAPATAVAHPGADLERPVDEHRPAIANEDACRHGGKAVPGSEQAAGLVERCADQPAVDDPGPGLVALPEGETRLVALDPLLGREREVDPLRIVAAPPARGIVVRRNVYRSPPRSRCAF